MELFPLTIYFNSDEERKAFQFKPKEVEVKPEEVKPVKKVGKK